MGRILTSQTCPTPHLDLQKKYSQYYLALAHLIGVDKEYTKFFEKEGKNGAYITLDNGAYEKGTPAPPGELIEKARLIHAKEIVTPDYFTQGEATEEATKVFLSKFRGGTRPGTHCSKKEFKLLAPAQGKTFEEWMHCFLTFYQDPWIDYIGLSFLIIKDCFQSFIPGGDVMQTRIFCTNLLSYLGLTKKPIHLLGLGNPLELEYQRRHSFVFRVDSSAAYDCGSQGFRFDKMTGFNRKIRKLDFKENLRFIYSKREFVARGLISRIEHNMKMVNCFAGIS